MFYFHYCVSLDILHPSIDPKTISERITAFRIVNETMVGTERRTKSGKLIEPRRNAALTHWGASLHQQHRINSDELELAEFLRDILAELRKHRDLFLELGEEGDVLLRIGWFSATSHSAASLDRDLLSLCGDIGLGIELNFYFDTAQTLAGEANSWGS